ncbi:BlaI/MecI/CopY family transcriptional regulator [bacterium]|nr:BlaI/MecI/CopY family transcriptional regulator [bacterium]
MSEFDPKELSPAEWKVLKIVWDLDEAPAREISKVAAETFAMSHSTVKVLLHRLASKGHLQTREIGNSFLYRAAGSMDAALCQAADELLQATPEHAAETLMLHLAKQSRLSPQGLQRLKRLLDEHDPGGGEGES